LRGRSASARLQTMLTAAFPSFRRALRVFAVAALAAGAAHAQYKVTNPDGTVTYTDRPPVTGNGRVSPVDTSTGTGDASASLSRLPLELRQVAQRYPVVLYVSTTDCAPCDTARALLKERGIPFTEKTVSSQEDVTELERRVGSRSVPALTVGAQSVQGMTSDVWNSYLDAAGYPHESHLPAGYQNPSPSPLVARKEAAPAPRAAEKQPAPTPEPAPVPPASGGFRF